MIYLFNSAYRPNYTKNVVKTLFLPEGCISEFRYRFKGERPNIDPTQVDEFLKFNNFRFNKEDVLICFIDRFATGGYNYHALRKGKLIKCYNDGDRLFFKVRLLDFISPNDNEMFKSHISNIGKLPKLTDNDPKNDNDGFYAIINNDITKRNGDYIFGSDAWDKITNDIMEAKAFKSTNEQETIFARLSIKSNRWFTKNKQPTIKKDDQYFKIIKNHKYTLNFYYKYPNQVNKNSINLNLSTNNSIKVINNECITIDSCSNNSKIIISSIKYCEDSRDNLKFEFTSNQGIKQENLISPNFTFSFKISDGLCFWIQLLIATVLFGMSEIIFSIDISQIKTITLNAILGGITITKLIGTLAKAIALFWIFRLIGKKIM